MAGVFISYRRGQAAGYAGRLADELTRRYGRDQVFRDIEAIVAGTDFVEAIDKAVASCRAVVLVITPGWADVVDEDGRRRLDNPEDFVRLEIESALRRGTWVIPVLVGGAMMPRSDQLPEAMRPLARRQAHEIRDASWDYNVEQLIAALERKGLKSPSPRDATSGLLVASGRPKSRKLPLLAAGLAGAVVTIAALAFAVSKFQASAGGPGEPTEMRAADTGGAETASGAEEETAHNPEPVQAKRTPSREQSQPAVGPGPGESSTDPKVERNTEALLRQQIEAAVAQASQAEIVAFRELDPGPLLEVYDGPVLETLLASLEELAMAGFHALNTLHSRRITSIDISPDGNAAEVEMVESWSSEYHNQSLGTCLYVPQHDAPQTLYLYRSPSGWKIEGAEHYAVAPDPVPC